MINRLTGFIQKTQVQKGSLRKVFRLLGVIDEEGYLHFIGRSIDTIKLLDSTKVSSNEVISIIHKCEHVRVGFLLTRCILLVIIFY